MNAPGTDLVEQYLDQLYARLRCAPRDARRILAEAEDHLREAVTDGLAAGLTQAEAEEQAVSSFGSVRAVVRAHDARLRRLPTLAVLRDVVMAAWRLGAIGLVAVGVSGLIAWVMNVAFGRGFVGGTPGAIRYSAADCHHGSASGPTRTAARRPRCWRTAATRSHCGWPRASSAWPRWPATTWPGAGPATCCRTASRPRWP
jgi:vacuolar-type H+-ATPase subunit H